MQALLTLLLVAASAIQGPWMASSNFSFDLHGQADTREGTWGRAEAATKAITFTPPIGYRVRILRASGDLVAWPLLSGPLPQDARYAGVLLGLQTTAPDGSVRGDWLADGVFLYVQAGLSREPVRISFDRDTKVGGLLAPDNKLIVKVASWLNTTGVPIHIEPTFTLTYCFEPI
jgi:hypothetical protein